MLLLCCVDGFAMMPNFTFGNAMTTPCWTEHRSRKNRPLDEGTRDGEDSSWCLNCDNNNYSNIWQIFDEYLYKYG